MAKSSTSLSMQQQPSQLRRSASAKTPAALVGVALRAASRHVVKGPELPSWNVAETAMVSILRTVLGGAGGSGAPSLEDLKVTRKAMEDRLPKQPKEISIEQLSIARKHAEFLPIGDPAILTGSVPCELVSYVDGSKPTSDGSKSIFDKVVLLCHGGAFIVGSPRSHRWASYACALKLKSRVLAVDYALAPEHKYPRGLLDSLSAYLALIGHAGAGHPKVAPVKSSQVILMGDSAGGGLCTALLLMLRDKGLPMPGGAVLMSPWTDLSLSDPFNQLHFSDYLPNDSDAIMGENSRIRFHEDPTGTYMYCTKREAIEDPYVSPLFAPSMANLPPILIQAGAAERPYGQAIKLAFRLAAEPEQNVTFESYSDQIHVFQLLGDAHPASKRGIARFLSWIEQLPPAGTTAKPEKKYFVITPKDLAAGTKTSDATPCGPEVFAKELLDGCKRIRELEGKHLMSKRKSYGQVKQRTSREVEVGEKLEEYEKAANQVLGISG
jgi:acetyl esterase/lipase